ncbi:MAG: GNAT family N-acetyltransferase [Candidatus Heimdallarchaeota archaeon]|nr:GNAT family N-acetyltransferase [Candidatus Heimdallarchaeota archaeon]
MIIISSHKDNEEHTIIDKSVEYLRVKSGKYLVRTSRQDISRGFRREGEHRFFRLEMTLAEAKAKLEGLRSKINETPIAKDIKLRKYSPSEEVNQFQELYNTIFMTSPDPTREITLDEAGGFPSERTTIAWLYNKMVGFIYLTIEEDPLETGEICGAVAGIGVLSNKRGMKIGAKLLEHAICFFEKQPQNITKMICEVYEKNVASLTMFRNLGMRIVGEMILEEIQPDQAGIGE